MRTSRVDSMQETSVRSFRYWRRRSRIVATVFRPLAIVAIAACGDSSPQDNATPDGGGPIIPPPPGPQVTGIAVEGGQSRQGSGAAPTNAPTIVHVTGSKLEGVISVTVGSMRGTIVANTPTQVTFLISVPHGAPLGVQALNLTTPEGSQSFMDGVTVAPITVASTGTDAPTDATAASVGTDGNPLRSLAKAISLAASGDTILLKDGVYDQAGGDDYVKPGREPNVPVGLTLRGESAGGAKLVGAGRVQCTDSTAQMGLILAGDTRIENLDLSGFCVAVYARAGTVTLRGLVVHNIGDDGIQASDAANITFDNVDVSDSGGSGAWIDGGATATFINGRFAHNSANGIYAISANSLTVTGTEFASNGTARDHAGIRAEFITSPASITITRANFHDNPYTAVLLNNPAASATITNSTFKNNPFLGLNVGGGESTVPVTVRGSVFSGSLNDVYLNGAPVDLGTPTSFGGNTFDTGQNDAAIANDRGSTWPPIFLTGNAWTGIGGQQPPTGCTTTDVPSASAPRRFWRIATPGSCTSATTGTGNVMLN